MMAGTLAEQVEQSVIGAATKALRAGNARLQTELAEAQRVSDGLHAAVLMGSNEQERLQTALEGAEAQRDEQKRITNSVIAVDVAGLREAWQGAERQLAEAQGHVARLEIALEASVEDLEDAEAQSKLRGEALELTEPLIESMLAIGITKTRGIEVAQALDSARAAIDITPEEAREKEGR